MSSDRRRSSRLIASPWLYNWPKKAPVFVDLEARQSSAEMTGRRKNDEDRGKGKHVQINDTSDEGDDFLTPCEFFSKSVASNDKRIKADVVKVVQGMNLDDLTDVGGGKVQEKSSKQGKMQAEVVLYSNVSDEQDNRTSKRCEMERKSAKRKNSVRRKKPLGVRRGNGSGKKKKTGKKVRSYEGYIQRKLSPSIMTDVINNLSKEQRQWVVNTGFGHILDFRMLVFTHNLGYNITDSFDGEQCCLKLKAGGIRIEENTVHSVLGFPKGDLLIVLDHENDFFGCWGEQFPGYAGCHITPMMVRNKILENDRVDKNFKLNFLVLVYNFFIEGQQNRFLNREILRSSVDIDKCGRYNWCRLLIEKLKKSHAFWAADKNRFFARPLAFLIYLYVSKVKNNDIVFVNPTFPSYRAWSDMLIRERQAFEIAKDCFGIGELFDLRRSIEDNRTIEELARGEIDLGSAMVEVCGEIHNEGNENKNEDCCAVNGENEENVEDSMFVEDSLTPSEKDILDDEEIAHVQGEYEGFEGEFGGQQFVKMHETAIIRDESDAIGMAGGEIEKYPLKGKLINDEGLMNVKLVELNVGSVEHCGNLMTQTEYMTMFFGNVNITETGNNSVPGVVNENHGTRTVESMSVVQSRLNDVSGLQGDKPVTPNLGDAQKKIVSSVSFAESSTQARLDEELDMHYAEEPYMKTFENNLMQLDVSYNKCLTNFIESLALYPDNNKLVYLKAKYAQYFKMFEESSPLSKSLLKSSVAHKVLADEDCVPSYSLGISQMSPKNLGASLENCVVRRPNVDVQGVAKKSPQQQRTATRVLDLNENYEAMNMRPRRGFMPTEKMRSPFVSRVIDVNEHTLTTEEKRVWEWLFQNNCDVDEILFEWNGRWCSAGHFQSLRWNDLVQTTIIDTWTYLLNEYEVFRSSSSPLRLFLSTETTFGPLQMKVDDKDNNTDQFVAFDDNVELVLQLVNELHNKEYDITDFDVILFPVFHTTHHYIIAYDIKKPRWEILDNRAQNIGFDEMYGKLPWVLHKCFCHFLECYSLPNYKEIEKMKPVVVSMSWQTMQNAVDCGIFVMRHLETYMGNQYKWKSGLKPEKENKYSYREN